MLLFYLHCFQIQSKPTDRESKLLYKYIYIHIELQYGVFERLISNGRIFRVSHSLTITTIIGRKNVRKKEFYKASYGEFKSFFISLHDRDIDSVTIMTSDWTNYCLGKRPVNNLQLLLCYLGNAQISLQAKDGIFSSAK